MRRVLALILVIAVATATILLLDTGGKTSQSRTTPAYTPAPPPPQANTTQPPPEITSLSGTLQALTTELQSLWDNMRDYNPGDPAVNGYLDWLEDALSTDAYRVAHALVGAPTEYDYRVGLGIAYRPDGWPNWWVDGRFFTERPPGPIPDEGPVRVGVVLVPEWGYGLIVTAYYDVEAHGLTVVIHSTVLDPETYKDEVILRGHLGYYGTSNQTAIILYRESIPTRGHPALVLDDGEEIPIENVVVLVEAPVVIKKVELPNPYYKWRVLERVDWTALTVLGRPAYGLGLHFAWGPGVDPMEEYKDVVIDLTESMVRYGSYKVPGKPGYGLDTYAFDYILFIRDAEPICSDYAKVSTAFATHVLGAIVDNHGGEDHQVALLVMPSRVYGGSLPPGGSWHGSGGPGDGPVMLPFDVDYDNVSDGSYVLDNIAPDARGLDWIRRIVVEYKRPIMIFEMAGSSQEGDYIVVYGNGWRMGGVGAPDSWTSTVYYFGLYDYMMDLPSWLQPPWHPVFAEEIYGLLPPETDPPLNLSYDDYDRLGWYLYNAERLVLEGNFTGEEFAPVSPVLGLPGVVPVVEVDVPAVMPYENATSTGPEGPTFYFP